MGLTFEVKNGDGILMPSNMYEVFNDGASFGRLKFRKWDEKIYVNKVCFFADLFFEEILQHFIEDIVIPHDCSACIFPYKLLTHNQKETLLEKGAKRIQCFDNPFKAGESISAFELQV